MTRTVISLAVVIVALVAGGATLAADAEPAKGLESEIRELEKKWEEAVLKSDVDFFERVLANDFTHTTQSGKFRNREQWLANHKRGQSNYDALNADDLVVRLYENVAIVSGRISPQGRDSHGRPIEGQYRFLRVWAKPQGKWQAVAFQSTRIDAGPSRMKANP